MSRTKFRFNTETLEYEKVNSKKGIVLLKVLGYLSLTAIIFFTGVSLSHNLVSSPKEKKMRQDLQDYELQVKLLQQKTQMAFDQLKALSEQDDHVYREIFGADPVDEDIRNAGIGGADKYSALDVFSNGKKLKELHENLDHLNAKMKVQSASYSELLELAKEKQHMLAAIPAIQPVANKDLKRVASGYGYRIDPIYRTRKMHKGIDFSARKGIEVYATGDGVIKKVKRMRWGYGTHIIIDHGYGYSTLYGHLSAAKVRRGQKVTRGQLIGLVGSTGKSTAPHLHYEVHRNGRAVNPIGYFYNDLSAEQYEEILKLSSNPNQSLD